MNDEQRNNYGFGRIYQRGGVWWIQYSFRGKRHRESSHSTNQSDAKRLLKKRHGEMGRGKLIGAQAERMTFADLAKMIRDDYAVNQRKSSERLESSIKHLEGFFSLSRVFDITTDRIRAYVRARMEGETPAKPATIRNEVAALKRMFTLATQDGRIADRPTFPTIEVKNTRAGFAEDGQVRAIVAALAEHYGHVVTFLHATGWRKNEVISEGGIAWRQVDFNAGWLRLDPDTTKNDEGRAFPFAQFSELKALIERRRELTEAMQIKTGRIIPWVFWHEDGQPICDFRDSWSSACSTAGVPRLLIHDLRRSAVRNLERAGVSRSAAMKLTGHKTESVYRRYAIVAEADQLVAVAKLARHRAAVAKQEAERKVIPMKGGRRTPKGTEQPQSATFGDAVLAGVVS